MGGRLLVRIQACRRACAEAGGRKCRVRRQSPKADDEAAETAISRMRDAFVGFVAKHKSVTGPALMPAIRAGWEVTQEPEEPRPECANQWQIPRAEAGRFPGMARRRPRRGPIYRAFTHQMMELARLTPAGESPSADQTCWILNPHGF
jgi:hypothetical protein